MSHAQVFMPRDFSLDPTDLLPDDGDEDQDYRWMEYCRTAATLNRDDILAVVLEELDTPVSPLYDLIDSALQEPHEPGHPRESITVLAGIGKAVMQIVAKAVDDAVGLRMACEEVRSWLRPNCALRCNAAIAAPDWRFRRLTSTTPGCSS